MLAWSTTVTGGVGLFLRTDGGELTASTSSAALVALALTLPLSGAAFFSGHCAEDAAAAHAGISWSPFRLSLRDMERETDGEEGFDEGAVSSKNLLKSGIRCTPAKSSSNFFRVALALTQFEHFPLIMIPDLANRTLFLGVPMNAAKDGMIHLLIRYRPVMFL